MIGLCVYQKKVSDVRARYKNVLNPIELFPELESDRGLVAPDGAEAEGLKVSLRQLGGSAGVDHTGWLTTGGLGTTESGPDGGVRLRPYLSPRNSARYPDYLRLDLRVSRDFDVGPGRWSVFQDWSPPSAG